jgi:hypothetical protein
LAYSRFSNAVANVQSQRIILWWQCLRLSVKLITATAGWRIESSAVSKQKIWKDIKKLPVTDPRLIDSYTKRIILSIVSPSQRLVYCPSGSARKREEESRLSCLIDKFLLPGRLTGWFLMSRIYFPAL